MNHYISIRNISLDASLLLLLLASLLFISCGKDDSINEPTNEATFSVNSILANSGRVASSSLDDAAFLLITIEKADGSSTDYSLERIELYQVGGEFISEKIALPIGDYNLTEFFVTDSENNITHIAPLEESEQAQNVSNPLPIQFSVLIDEITSVDVEVISSEDLSLEDFGLAGFNLSEVDLFNFSVTVSELGNYENLLDGTVTVVSGEYQLTKSFLAITSNSIVIRDGFSSYEVTIESEGYESYSYSFTKDSLEYYESIPLVIELTSESDQPIPGDGFVEIYVDGLFQEYNFAETQLWNSSKDNTPGYWIRPMDWSIPEVTQVEWIIIYPSRLSLGETVVENVTFPSFYLPLYVVMSALNSDGERTSFNVYIENPSKAVITINSIGDTINGNIALTTYHPLSDEFYEIIIFINDLPFNIDL